MRQFRTAARCSVVKRLRRHVRAAERSGKYAKVSGWLAGRCPRVVVMRRYEATVPVVGQACVAIGAATVNYYGFVQVKK